MTSSSEPPPKPPRPPYWDPLIIDGKPVDLAHLEPFRHTFRSKKLNRDLTFNVRFANHCFTDHFREGVHAEGRKIMDGSRARVFCETRYGLSRRLPDLIRDLPNQIVYRTRTKRNFVYAVRLDDGAGGSYSFYFTVEKEKTTHHQILIVVESAYAVTADQMDGILVGAYPMPFAVLCADTFHVLPVKPKAKR